jgi:hypothetical protein
MEVGQASRLPKGRIVKCPKCGLNGLELIYSQTRGRYIASYWHLAHKDAVGNVPLMRQACTIKADTKREFDRARQG